ncbi:class I SAM-dependent methyltransferase [Lysinibacillus mangiferihumi]|uniref:Class I SAM-dependent methyltransferase n=1 Tax=Lysinibacillus mangiferihumi TaxID=1130819 RepID=A0A4U2ZDP1_9BACI|nr:class I SAM-dependent methyltransferase [Lysinibacillus mangiferihumi]TKI72836.1 class I SAM-dependent methyltransferase [Lysinibacillus mangiferihumi]
MYKNEGYWNNFYLNNKELKNASEFIKSDYLSKYNAEEYLILELGCGAGADSFYLANKCFEVIAIDGSETAITKNKALENNFVEFFCKNLSDEKEVKNLLYYVNEKALRGQKNILIYTRFFLHSISESVEDILLSAIKVNSKVPTSFVSEFRVKEDEKLYKVFNNHYRRYVDTNLFLEKFINEGFEVEKFEKARGLSPFKDEDPFLARVSLRYNLDLKSAKI